LGRKILDLFPAEVSSANGFDAPPKLLNIRDVTFQVIHKGNPRSVDSALAEGAARMVVYAVFMLLAISAAWITIEIGIVRRVLTLTRRTAEVSRAARADGDLGRFDFSDLRGRDELGVLAAGVDDLLRKISDDLQRAQIRVEHEKDMLRAIGHEIRSPLQSLSALHTKEVDPSRRYIRRMLQAVQALYGSASPTDGVESVAMQDEILDVSQFLQSVAENAPDAGIDGVVFEGVREPTLVRADAAALEDAITHILMNATRYRPPGTAITVGLSVVADTVIASIHNHGPHVPEDMIGRIFEYGVSDQPDGGALGNRGQGLFVAKTYLAKMGGSIAVHNRPDGVQFDIWLPVVQQEAAEESLPLGNRVTRWLRA
jgi:signal transduction histidine kinase